MIKKNFKGRCRKRMTSIHISSGADYQKESGFIEK